MTSETVIQLRAREEVRRRPEGPRGWKPMPATVPILVHGDVSVEHLLRAAQAVGLEFHYDERLCAIVIYPAKDTG